MVKWSLAKDFLESVKKNGLPLKEQPVIQEDTSPLVKSLARYIVGAFTMCREVEAGVLGLGIDAQLCDCFAEVDQRNSDDRGIKTHDSQCAKL